MSEKNAIIPTPDVEEWGETVSPDENSPCPCDLMPLETMTIELISEEEMIRREIRREGITVRFPDGRVEHIRGDQIDITFDHELPREENGKCSRP